MSLDRGGGPESSKSSWFSTRFHLRVLAPHSQGPEVSQLTASSDTYNKALEVLARGPRATKDLGRWLAQREHSPDDINAVLARLTERGLLNDPAYATMLARSRLTTHHMSRRRIAAELAKRGIDRSVADAAIAGVMEDEAVDERAMVRTAGAKKLKSLAKLDPDLQRRRVYGFLARKGFPADLVREVVAELLRDTHS